MIKCPICLHEFEKGIGVYKDRHLRTVCGWTCVQIIGQRAIETPGWWPPPIPPCPPPDRN